MSNNSSNKLNVPQAREAMDRFKMQAAQEVGVNLKQGYNGDLGKAPMVRKMCPVRSARFDRNNRIAPGHTQTVEYITFLTL